LITKELEGMIVTDAIEALDKFTSEGDRSGFKEWLARYHAIISDLESSNPVSDLLCCPFCGKQPETYWDNSIGEECYREGFNIKCCHVHVYAIYKEEAIEKWNRRAT